MTAALFIGGHAALIVWLLVASKRRSMNMIGAAPVLWGLLIIIGVLTTTPGI